MIRLPHVALIMPDMAPARRMVARGVARYARDVARWELYAEEDSKPWMPDLRTWRGDGAIVCVEDPKILQAALQLKTPLVGLVGMRSLGRDSLPFPCFSGDDVAIGRMGAEHLLDQGHRRLAFFGLAGSNQTGWAHARERSFRQTARRAGTPCNVFRGREGTSRRWLAVQDDLRQWLRRLEKPVGLMACSDPLARQVLRACRAESIHVSEEVAVLGVDNDALLCEVTCPPLSSVDPADEQVGYLAAQLLDRMMRGVAVPPDRRMVQPLRVVRRQSTDALAMPDADMAEALRFIRAHACEKIGLGHVVEAVGVSRSGLATRFKAATGRTVHEEVQRVRVDRARDLLLTTDLSLKQIAAQSGFANTQHMARLFRLRLGLTPGELRGMSPSVW